MTTKEKLSKLNSKMKEYHEKAVELSKISTLDMMKNLANGKSPIAKEMDTQKSEGDTYKPHGKLNRKCPRCGSTKVQLSSERSKHGFFWLILFGFFYLTWVMIKIFIAFMVFIMFDWWMAAIKKSQGKGYSYYSKRIITNKPKIYYCHNCGNNFRG